MASYHGPKAKVQRRYGEVLVSRPKYQKIMEKRPYPPGEHGKDKQFRSGRRSNYGLQLSEKQKLAFVYNVRDRQMRGYYIKARNQPGNTGTNLLVMLERRLDNVVYRGGFAATIWAARQLVGHGHVLVNGSRLNIASYSVNVGDEISVTDKMKQNVHVVESLEAMGALPDYLSLSRESMTVSFNHVPERQEVPVPVDEQLIVEWFNRLT
jgi:small subunit ribosomal protein S4